MKLLENTFCAGGLPRGGLELCSCSSKENIGKVPVLCTSAFSFFATMTDVLQQWRHITVSQSISVSSLQLFVLSQVFVKTACMARRLILCGSGTEHTWIQRLTCSLIHIEHILWISCYWLPQKQSEPGHYEIGLCQIQNFIQNFLCWVCLYEQVSVQNNFSFWLFVIFAWLLFGFCILFLPDHFRTIHLYTVAAVTHHSVTLQFLLPFPFTKMLHKLSKLFNLNEEKLLLWKWKVFTWNCEKCWGWQYTSV